MDLLFQCEVWLDGENLAWVTGTGTLIVEALGQSHPGRLGQAICKNPVL